MKYTELKNYLIAVDLDGTIIDNGTIIDEESFAVLQQLSINNYVVIATGRPFRSSIKYYNLLTLNTPIINYNGAYIHHPKDNTYTETMITIPRNELIKLLEDNKDLILNAFCEIRDEIFLLKLDDLVKPFLDLEGGNLHIGDFKDILVSNSNGAIIFTKQEHFSKIKEYVNNNFKDLLIRPWDFNGVFVIEVYNKHISKAKAVKDIMSYYHIDENKSIAFGDGANDLEMLLEVKYGVAMQNSSKLLLDNAKYKTSSIKEHGVKTFFECFNFPEN